MLVNALSVPKIARAGAPAPAAKPAAPHGKRRRRPRCRAVPSRPGFVRDAMERPSFFSNPLSSFAVKLRRYRPSCAAFLCSSFYACSSTRSIKLLRPGESVEVASHARIDVIRNALSANNVKHAVRHFC